MPRIPQQVVRDDHTTASRRRHACHPSLFPLWRIPIDRHTRRIVILKLVYRALRLILVSGIINIHISFRLE